ncbi:MAG: glycoside hydrolase TIM-barrel-like domain-containing protein, partial [Pseudomonadota bacterium]
IDAVGIDYYHPLSDWRDGREHLDASSARSIYDLSYLRANLAGGEYYDWYYASDSDRENQLRTPITDGTAGKPWVFRTKDLWSWWREPHYNRPAGIESAAPTAWVPESKPIWLTELGCPAVDLGSNQPNVFVDPKSSESHLPHFSYGRRDDLMQRRYIEAVLGALDPVSDAFIPELNPVSSVSGARMFDPSRLYIYTWDARPYPAFPNARDIWSDGDNWRLGHWLNGRLGAADLGRTVLDLLQGHDGLDDIDVTGLHGVIPGYVVDRVMSSRAALQPLELAYAFDGIDSAGTLRFRHRGDGDVVGEYDAATLVDFGRAGDLASLMRGQDSELPGVAAVGYINGDADYEVASAASKRLVGKSQRISLAEFPIVLSQDRAETLAEDLLHAAWSSRERASMTLPPSSMPVEAGDHVRLHFGDRSIVLRVTRMTSGLHLDVEGQSIAHRSGAGSRPSERRSSYTVPDRFGPTDLSVIELPLLPDEELADADRVHVAAVQSPWPGRVPLLTTPDGSDASLAASIGQPATIGELLTDMAPGAAWRWSHGSAFDVQMFGG